MMNYDKLPEHMRSGVQDYVDHGYPVGDFLMAVLSNNLVEAYIRADDKNMAAMKDWVSFLYWEMPSNMWGSKEKVMDWIEKRSRGREQ